MSDDNELEQRIGALEAAKANFEDARTSALILADQNFEDLQPDSEFVASARLFHELIALTEAAMKAEASKRTPFFGVI